MKIKSIQSFRQWYKNLTPARKEASQFWDENFMGVQHNDISGFFTMYHGDKVEVYDFLRKEVEMAEDGQAIYEFVQNAADSDSTKFYMFYNEHYLAVINNGKVFSKEGVKSILNIGQSYGKDDPDKIGRYGIGFKLVHRLVGKSSGLDELLNIDSDGYRGPILFSWSEKSQFSNFLNSNQFEYVDFEEKNTPWLLKILITNFPAQPEEIIKDIKFNEIEPFQSEELKSFQDFLNSCSDKIDLNSLDNGTVFFLKLGDKKFEYLERQKQEYLNGLSTSMHFLKSLDTLVINDNVIKKDIEATNVLEFNIQNGSDEFKKIGLTEIRDKESEAKFKICFADNSNSAIEIKKHPNIYKYFPAVKEVNQLSFVIHSNLFELSSNRQNLTETPVNKNLLELLSKQVIYKMEVFKTENRNTFKNLFTSILMSEESSNNYSGNGWQSEYYYNNLLKYIQNTIPTKGNKFSTNAQNVKINKLNSQLNLNLDDFGLSHIQWFEWDYVEDEFLIDEAKKENKLGIEEWGIRDIVENSNLENINYWIATCDQKTYDAFLKEIDKIYLREETKKKLFEIKMFKFSDDMFYSINNAWTINNIRETFQERSYNQYRKTYEHTTKTRIVQKRIQNESIVFITDKTSSISSALQNLGFAVSIINFSIYKDIYYALSENLPKEKDVYNAVAEKCKTNHLSVVEKKKLFLNLLNDTTRFDNVTESELQNLELFCDNHFEIKPLDKLLNCKQTIYNWLNKYKIKEEEYFPQLNSFLISESEDIFKIIFQQNKDEIISKLSTFEEIKSLINLYQNNQKAFFKEFIIMKKNNEFMLIEKTDDTHQVQTFDKETRKFIDENCTNILNVLPYDFIENFKDEEGVIKGDELHILILDIINVEEHKEILIDIVKYKAKHKLLQKLSEFRFNSEIKYNKEDYQYKVLDLACNELKEIEYQSFRNKIIIETSGQKFNYSEIPKNRDRIILATKEFNLAKILPTTYQNSNLISDLINLFSQQGISREHLNALFGVNEELNLDDLFEKFTAQSGIFQNPEQMFFLIYYHKHIANVNLSMLGFNIDYAVFPSEFAIEEENLPEYLQKWVLNKEIKLKELEEVGVYTENSTLVSLRKFFLSKIDFNVNSIAVNLSSKETMLLNTLKLIKEKGIKLNSENEFYIFKEIVRVINSNRSTEQELKIQDEYNFKAIRDQSHQWKTVGNYTILLHNGALPKIVKLNEIDDYVFYHFNETDFAVNETSIFINEYADIKKTLHKVASDDNNNFSFENLWALFEEEKNGSIITNNDPNSSFLEEVNEFISNLEESEWSEIIPELKSLIELSISHPKEKQKLFNLIAKIKLAKEINIQFDIAEKDFNILVNNDEKYFVHSARGAFAYIHPNEILKMRYEGYKMALDFSTKSRIKIYHTPEEILKLNSNHILAYQHEKTMDDLFEFCEVNKDAHKHLLIIDKDNSGEKSKALLKLLNIEDDYQ